MKNLLTSSKVVRLSLIGLVVGATVALGAWTAKVHNDGPDKIVVESGGEIELLSGATIDVQSGATFSVGDGSQVPGDLAVARGFAVIGNSSGVGAAYDANDSGKILVGDGTDLLSVAVSGDATLASNGALTIANDAVSNAKLADITRGSVKVGGAANAPTDLDANDSGKILVGDGTDIASVAVSGDATLASNGALTVAKLNGAKYIAGLATTGSASDTIVSGLATVVACVCSLDSDPGDDPFLVSCDLGDQAGAPAAGSFYLKTWKHDGADPTPTAASTFSKSVAWFCKGT